MNVAMEAENAVPPVQEKSAPADDAASRERKSMTPSEASNPLKRKQSSETTEPEAPAKKTRTDSEPPEEKTQAREDTGEDGDAPLQKDTATASTVVEARANLEHRSRRPPQPVDERKRNKRLFGAVLGALGQNASPQVVRRREIDRKQREKLRAQAQENESAREARLVQLTAARRREQKRFDRESLRIRHDNMRAMAHSLKTRAEPRLYYKPRRLRAEEEERIERQIAQADEEIARELEHADDRDHGPHDSDDGKGEDKRERDVKSPRTSETAATAKGEEKSPSTKIDDGDVAMIDQQNTPTAAEARHHQPAESHAEQSSDAGASQDDSKINGKPAAAGEEEEGAEEEADMDGDDAVIY